MLRFIYFQKYGSPINGILAKKLEIIAFPTWTNLELIQLDRNVGEDW